MDPNECYIRGKVVGNTNTGVIFEFNGEQRTTMKQNVFKCGQKNPFLPCTTPTTIPLNIKFAPATQVPVLAEKNIGNYLYDTGEVSKLHGIFI